MHANLKKRITSAGIAAMLVLSTVFPAQASEISSVSAPVSEGSSVSVYQQDELPADYGETDSMPQEDSGFFMMEDESEDYETESEASADDAECEQETETVTDPEAESGSENVKEDLAYIIYLPEMDGVDYAYDEDAYDTELSGDDYFVLLYYAGDEVEFRVDTDMMFDVIDTKTNSLFNDAFVEDGNVSFAMPEQDLTLVFTEFADETETAKETEIVQADAETESQTDEISDGNGPVIIADGSDGISYEFDQVAYSEGDTVRFTVKAEPGFIIDSVLAKDEDGALEMNLIGNEAITSDDAEYAVNLDTGTIGIITQEGDLGNSSETYEFVMPESDVSINSILNNDILLIVEGVPDKYSLNTYTQRAPGLPNDWVNGKLVNGVYQNVTGTTYKEVAFTKDGKTSTHPAYCLQPAKGTPPSLSSYTMKEVSNKYIAKALYYLYGGPGWNDSSELKKYMNKNGAADLKYGYYAISHWVVSYAYDSEGFNAVPNYKNVVNATGVTHLRTLYEMIMNMDDVVSPTFEFDGDKLVGVYDASQERYVTNSATFRATKGTSVTLTTNKNITIVNETTKKRSVNKATIRAGETFHLEGNSKIEAGKNYTYNGTYSAPVDFKALRFDTSAGTGYQDLGLSFFTDDTSVSIKVKWKKVDKETVYVHKRMGDQEVGVFDAISAAYPFTGAQYAVYNDKDLKNLVDTITLDSNGNGTSKELAASEAYYIKEVVAPTCGAYLLDTNTVYVANEENDWTIEAVDKPFVATLNIQKAVVDLDWMSEDQKQDLYNSNVLTNVEFRLTHENALNLGRYGVKTVKCDKFGNATITDMICGRWRIEEIQTPSKYYASMDGQYIDVKPGSQTVSFHNVNMRHEGWIQLLKKDAETGNTIILDHSTFQLYRYDDLLTKQWTGPIKLTVQGNKEPADTFTTDPEGYVRFDQALDGGRYKVVETDPPAGYEILKEGVEFEIDSDNDASSRITIEVPEKPVYGRFQVTKVDDKTSDHCGAGYTFNVYVEENILDGSGAIFKDDTTGSYIAGTLVDTIVTDENGVATSRLLRPGKYYIQETGVSGDGHTLNPNKYSVVVPEKANNNEPYLIPFEIANGKNHLDLFKKDSETGEALEGITFRIKLKNSEDSESQLYVTDAEGHFGIDGLQTGEYTVQEVATIPGYNLSDEIISFTVDSECLIEGNTEYKIEMTNKPNIIHITKRDITNKAEVPGASLKVTDINGNVIDEWISTEEPHEIQALPAGEYTLTETLPPELYELSEDVTFTVTDSVDIQTFYMDDSPYREVQVSKKDLTGLDEIPGAHLVITDETGNIIDEWDSTTQPHMLPLHSGRYTLTETKPADGYVTAEAVTFDVLKRGESDFDIQHVEMFDDVTKVEICKQSITGDEEIPGAYLEVRNEDGEVVEEWESTEEPHYIEMLPIGKYTLTETQAPDGYATAETIEFEVLDTEDIQTVVMHDDVTKVEVSKQDVTNSKELPGARLVIKDEDGNEVEEWVSTNKPHYIEMLPVGKYTLTEITAPAGYDVAETVNFEVLDTAEIQHVVMYDSPTPVPASAPQTGDDFNAGQLVLIIAIVIILLIAAAVLFLKKGKKCEKAPVEAGDDTPDKN